MNGDVCGRAGTIDLSLEEEKRSRKILTYTRGLCS
jgi:hypothetical protein